MRSFRKKSNRRSKKSVARDKYRNRFACCNSNHNADTGRYARGHHNHAQDRGPLDHATGVGFVKDASSTKAVIRQMKELGVI